MKRYISLILLLPILFCILTNVSAQEITLDNIADLYIVQTIENTDTATTTTYTNLQEFYTNAFVVFPELTSLDLATFAVEYTNWSITNPSEHDILEILEFETVTSSSQVLYVTASGETAPMNYDEARVLLNGGAISPYSTYVSDDGYLQITTNLGNKAYDTNGETIYVVSSNFRWLYMPVYELIDTFAIVYGNAAFDDSYAITSTFTEKSTCTMCGSTDTISTKEVFLNETTTASDYITLDYSQSNAIGAKYNLTNQVCMHIVNSDALDYSKTNTIEGSLKFRLIVNGTTEAKAAYAHTKIAGIISISGISTGESVSVEFGGSVGINVTKYVAAPVTLRV